MVSVQDLTAADVADDAPETVNVGQTLSKVRVTMEDNHLRTIPVVDGDRFVGMLSYRDLMEKLRSDPSKMKIDSLVHAPPEVEEDQNLVELSMLRINSGRKKFALVGEHDRLAGVVGEREVVYPARDAEELQQMTVEQAMTADVVTIEQDKSIESARKMVRDNDISRLLVVDGAGELVGLLSSLEVLKAMVPREQMQGGHGKRSGAEGAIAAGDVKGEKGSFSEVPVSELMDQERTVSPKVIEDASTGLPDAIDFLREEESREVVVVEEERPVGILTLKDIVSVIAGQEVVESLLVQLTGPEVPEEKQVIHDKVETAIRGGLGRLMKRPEELSIHMKKYETDGKRHKYSLNFKLSSKEGVTTVKTHGWDLLDAVDEGLEKLETVLKKEKEKRIDQKRDRQRKGKYSS